MRRLLFATLLLLAFVGCSVNKNSGEVAVVEVNPLSTDVIPLSSFVKDVEFVTLELTDDSVIKRVNELFFYEDKYIVADHGSDAIYMFDKQGRYLSKIARKGRANSEYLNLDDVMLDDKRGVLIVKDFSSKKFLYYNLAGECVDVQSFKDNCTHYFQDVINLANGNFLCYEFAHGVKRHSYDGIWEMTPSGDIVRWVLRNELIHPTSSPLYAMAYNTQGNVSIMNIEENSDMEYDGELKTIVKYDVKGKTAKDYAGMNNTDYAPRWGQGKMFNTRYWAYNLGRYTLSKWSGEERDFVFYSLYDTRKNSIKVGPKIDFTTAKGTQCYPSVVLGNTKEAIEVIPSNLRDAIVVPLYADTFLSDKYASAAEKLLDGGDVEQMNPILQIWKIK